MEQSRSIVLFLMVLVAAALLFRRATLDAVIEAINNFRGGPPTPMHPSPVNDAALLRRRTRTR
jgi:hypothetical protein